MFLPPLGKFCPPLEKSLRTPMLAVFVIPFVFEQGATKVGQFINYYLTFCSF